MPYEIIALMIGAGIFFYLYINEKKENSHLKYLWILMALAFIAFALVTDVNVATTNSIITGNFVSVMVSPTGSNVNIYTGALANSPIFLNPLNAISVGTGFGITISNSVLNTFANTPIFLNSANQVSLAFGSGLSISNNQLIATGGGGGGGSSNIIGASAPLTVSSNIVTLAYDNSNFSVTSQGLQLNQTIFPWKVWVNYTGGQSSPQVSTLIFDGNIATGGINLYHPNPTAVNAGLCNHGSPVNNPPALPCSYILQNGTSYFPTSVYTNNTITSTVTANYFYGLRATTPITITNANTIGCPTCATSSTTANIYLANSPIIETGASSPFSFGLGPVTYLNGMLGNILFNTNITTIGNLTAVQNVIIEGGTGHLATLTYGGGSNKVSTLPAITGTLASLGATAQTFAGAMSFSAEPNSISTTGNVVVPQIVFKSSTTSTKQFVTSNSYTNTNSTMWIIYAEPQTAGASMQFCEKYILKAFACNTANTLFNIATPLLPTNEVTTLMIPDYSSFNIITTGTWSYNTFVT